MPPNDPRFLDASFDDMVIDLWAHRFADDPKLAGEDITDDFEAELQRMEKAAAARPAPPRPAPRAASVTVPAAPGGAVDNDDWEVIPEE